MNHNKVLAIKWAKRAQELWQLGVPATRAIEIVRPLYFSEVKRLNAGMKRRSN